MECILWYVIGVECTGFLMYAMYITWKEDLGQAYIIVPALWPIAVPLGTIIIGGALILEMASNLKTIKANEPARKPPTAMIVPYQIYRDGKYNVWYDMNGAKHWA